MVRVAEKKEKAGGFSQVANVLFHGYPELDMQDRYVVMALSSVCWKEEFYALSLRKIAELTRVNHTALRSRGGQHPREGVLDRLKRFGLLDLKEDRGKEGRVQTFVCVLYSRIWGENVSFKKETSLTTSTHNPDTTVDTVTNIVDHVNTSVDHVNTSVDHVNTSVDNASSNVAPNTINTKNTYKTIEDSMQSSIVLPATKRFANASPTRILPEIDLLCEDLGLAIVTRNKPTIPPEVSHSQVSPQPTISQGQTQEKGNPAPSSGYTNVKSKSRKKASKPVQATLPVTDEAAYSADEQCRFDWYCSLDCIHARPKQTPKRKEYCSQLVDIVHTQEEMVSLADHAKQQMKVWGKEVYVVEMGLLVNATIVSGWKEKQRKIINIREKQQSTVASTPVPDFIQRNMEEKRAKWEELKRKREQNAQEKIAL